jgi:hypothetical protein
MLDRLAKGEKSKLSRQEIKDVNKRLYNRLPEVK